MDLLRHVGQVRAGRGGLQPGQEAGERLLRHGQLNVVGVTGGELDDDAADAEDAAPVTPASTRCPSSTTCGGLPPASLTGPSPAADRHSNHGFSESAEVLTLYLCQIPRESDEVRQQLTGGSW